MPTARQILGTFGEERTDVAKSSWKRATPAIHLCVFRAQAKLTWRYATVAAWTVVAMVIRLHISD